MYTDVPNFGRMFDPEGTRSRSVCSEVRSQCTRKGPRDPPGGAWRTQHAVRALNTPTRLAVGLKEALVASDGRSVMYTEVHHFERSDPHIHGYGPKIAYTEVPKMADFGSDLYAT